MFRQSSRRNGRNKGLKIKHVLQISVLLGVSVWLLYQLHHSDDKKQSSVKTNITEKAWNDSSKETFKLGRKDLRPKVNETEFTDEKGNENEEIGHDHGSEEHVEVGENEHIDDGNEKKEKGDKRDDGGSKNEVATKEENGSEKSGEREEGNTGNGEENKKESIHVREKDTKNKEGGRKKEVKQVHKTGDEINENNEQNKVVVMEKEDKPKKKMKPNPKKFEISRLSSEEEYDDDDDQSLRKEVENVSREKYKEKRQENKTTSSGKEPSNDEHIKASSKKEREIDENQNTKKVSNKQTGKQQQIDTSPGLYVVVPSTTNSTGKTDSDYDSEAQEDKNENDNNNNEAADESVSGQMIEKDGESILEEEKDALSLTDLGTLPETETGGSLSHDDAATE